MLTQFFFEEFNWNKEAIIEWINKYLETKKKVVSKAGPKLINPSIEPNNVALYN